MQDLPIIVLGAGGVGRAFVRQIVENRGLHAEQYGLWLSVLAVCDRDGAVLGLDSRREQHGLDDPNLLDLVRYKAEGGRLAEHRLGGPQNDLAAVIDIAGRPGAVVVDCTATEETAWALLFALERKYKVVLANKKPLTIDQEVYDRLTRAGGTGDSAADDGRALRHLGRCRWETTCGAALPVVSTLNRLVAAGDAVHKIAGTLSGTLGFVMTGLQAGQPFSEVVREAHRLGYTEPDPRDDLGGLDVARKALILARGLGWRLDMRDVQVRGLYPAEMSSLSVPDVPGGAAATGRRLPRSCGPGCGRREGAALCSHRRGRPLPRGADGRRRCQPAGSPERHRQPGRIQHALVQSQPAGGPGAGRRGRRHGLGRAGRRDRIDLYDING